MSDEKFGTDEYGAWIISDKYDGKPRKLYRKPCERPMCGRWFLKPKHTDQKYCSTECRDLVRTTEVVIQCAYCGRYTYKKASVVKRAEIKGSNLYCNRECKEHDQAYKGNNYREKAFRFNRVDGKVSCSRCGYDSFEEMLDVHHVDNNRGNNNLNNLEILCVWCHAMETRHVPTHAHTGSFIAGYTNIDGYTE